MDPVERQQLEHPIRQAIAAEDRNGATTAVLRLYGGELYGFLCSVARDQTIADEAYSELCEVVWKQLGAFRWEASLRSWLYALARRLVLRLRVDGYRRAARARPMELAPEVIEVAARMRTSTLEIQRSDVKSAFRALRDELSEEDQELLALRVDRDLSWRDIARILESGDEAGVEAGAAEGATGATGATGTTPATRTSPATGTSPATRTSPAIDSLAATLRKRFERVRGRLRELASERGLLPEGD